MSVGHSFVRCHRSRRLESGSRRRRSGLENIANIQVPVIAAIEGRAHVHSDYALLASVIVAADGATFRMWPFSAGVAPGDGILPGLSRWSGTGERRFLLNPQFAPGAYRLRMGSGCRSCAER